MRSSNWQRWTRWRRAALILGLAPAAAMAVVACSEPQPPPESAKNGSDGGAAPSPVVPPATPQGPAALGKVDSGIPDNAVQLGAIFMQTPIMNDMEWPYPESTPREARRDPARAAAMRIGYIRRGSKVFVLPEPHKKENCKDGWYELVGGGFVCGKYATVDLNHPKIKTAPHPPYMNAALPYDYGYNVGNGTPLYRHVPSWDERVKLEPWLSPQARPKRGIEESNPYAVADAGAPTLVNTSSNDPFGVTTDPLDAGAGTPWYLRDYDGGKPTVTLDELREDEGGPVVRRMVKGFYLALDKETKDNRNVKWWKTTEGFVAPYTRIFVNKSVSDFHGVWLTGALPDGAPTTPGNPPAADAGAPLVKIADALPVGFVLWRGKKYTLSDDKKSVTAGEVLPRFTSVPLTGQSVVVGNMRYEETTDGFFAKTAELVIVRDKPEGAPKDLAPGEKWIYVNLKTETLTAYEGDKPVFVTLVSTGKKSDISKEKDHRTKPGTFRIREKHIAATMDGDVATDGPYSIEDVPWIMYFNGSIALHGAFWHSNFGHEQSHGCVNLAPLDARALFGWTEPQLPDGWHGVMSTPEKPGTRVVVFDPDCPKNDCEVHYKDE